MSKIKIIFFIIIAFIIYKGVVAFKNFEIGVSDRVAEIEELADYEKEEEVIGLMMYLGDPPELKEHLFTESRSKCLKLKKIAEETSFAYYECAKVNAVIKNKKIVSIIEEINELIEAVENDANKIHEAADVFYHLAMYLEANDIKIEEVMSELNKRKK